MVARKQHDAARPPEQITLVYRCVDGAHSFTLLEVPGLVVLEPDLKRAFKIGVEGANKLVSAICQQPVKYDVETDFADFKRKVSAQSGTVNKAHIVTVAGRIHRSEERISA